MRRTAALVPAGGFAGGFAGRACVPRSGHRSPAGMRC